MVCRDGECTIPVSDLATLCLLLHVSFRFASTECLSCVVMFRFARRGCWDWFGSTPGGGANRFDTHDGDQLTTVLKMVNDMDNIIVELTGK